MSNNKNLINKAIVITCMHTLYPDQLVDFQKGVHSDSAE